MPDSLNYSPPKIDIGGSKNYVRVPPISGTNFTSGQNIKFIVNSDDKFLDQTRSYLSFKLTFTGTFHANHRLRKVGLMGCVRQVDTSLNGTLIESFPEYADYLSILYPSQPVSYQTVLKKLETYNDVANAVVSTSAGVGAGKYCTGPLRCGILEQKNAMIPISMIRGGLQIDLTLDTLSRFLANNEGSALTEYTLSDVYYVACFVKPPNNYLINFQNTLAAGRTATIPLEVVRVIRNTPTNASETTEPLNVGYIKSLKSWYQTINTNSPTASTAIGSIVDHSANFTANGHTGYHIELSGTRYPQNYDIGCSLANGDNPENIQQLLTSVDNSFPLMDFNTGGNFLFYEFSSNKSFGSGVPVSDSLISIVKKGTPTSTSVNQNNYFFSDAVVRISSTSVTLDTEKLEVSVV